MRLRRTFPLSCSPARHDEARLPRDGCLARPNTSGRLPRDDSSPRHIRADRGASIRPQTRLYKTDGRADRTYECNRPGGREILQWSWSPRRTFNIRTNDRDDKTCRHPIKIQFNRTRLRPRQTDSVETRRARVSDNIGIADRGGGGARPVSTVGFFSTQMQPFNEHFDVVVVGAGHAGCEAAMASARMGLKTALYTLNVDLIAQMSCNPAVGGIAKGHLVREVDALGGIMGEITDAVGIQFRLLNTSRGPAVWSPRAQCDKQAYRLKMREVLEAQPNLQIKQAEVAELIVEEPTGNPSLVVARRSLAENLRTSDIAKDKRRTTNDALAF